MTITIDTVYKTVKTDGAVKLTELIDALKKMFPEDWENFSVISTNTVTWYPMTGQPLTWQNPTGPYDIICQVAADGTITQNNVPICATSLYP